MTPRLLLPLLLLGAATALPGPLPGQVIRGRLLDDATDRPLPDGLLTLTSGDTLRLTARTDAGGEFLLRPGGAGVYSLRAERSGYFSAAAAELKLGASDTLEVRFSLSTEVVMLDPVVVKGRDRRSAMLAGFDRRSRERLTGVFFTRADVERLHPQTTTALLARVPGVQLTPRNLGDGNHVAIRGNCSPTVYVDGTRVPLYGMVIDDLMTPLDLEGMEVYKNASDAPVEYGGIRAGCAVILLWSRHGE